jgi:hypothetical protein
LRSTGEPGFVRVSLTEDPSSPAAQALGRLGLTGDVVSRDIERVIGPCIDPRRHAIDPDALATLGIDLDEVNRRVEERSEPAAVEDCIAAQILAEHDVTPTALRQALR